MSALGPAQANFEHVFNMFNNLHRMSETASHNKFLPSFDVKEDKDAYTLEGEVPGIERKDIVIEFSDDQTLTIRGRTKHSREEGQRPHAVSEIKEGEAPAKESGLSDNKDVATTGSKEVAHRAPAHQLTYWLSERSVGEFARSFSFPSRVDQNNVKASLENGILSVVLPKRTEQNISKRISIE